MDEIKDYWENETCGTGKVITGDSIKFSKEWFDKIEEYRYAVEPFIHSAAQFTRHRGKKLLEIGVGAGTDHLQWARAGALCHGVDLTQAAIETTKLLFEKRGYKSSLQNIDAESLPFPNDYFDIVYSWGVIHHSENPQHIIDEIRRTLKPGGMFIGMMYARHSLWMLMMWVRFALLKARPWRTFSKVLFAGHSESKGTKAYTIKELGIMFKQFSKFEAKHILTNADKYKWPVWLRRHFPENWGWYIEIKAQK